MLRNYFKIAWRNLQKSRISSFVNISGLAVGMAVAMLTGLWLHDELSFNKYHEHYDRVARVAEKGVGGNGPFMNVTLSYALISELKDHYSDRFQYLVRSTNMGESILSSGDSKISRIGQYMDEDAPYLLSLKMIRGSRAGLRGPHSILLSASTAKALFGNIDPMGHIIGINNDVNVTVAGVYDKVHCSDGAVAWLERLGGEGGKAAVVEPFYEALCGDKTRHDLRRGQPSDRKCRAGSYQKHRR